jgi:hypothetical protein
MNKWNVETHQDEHGKWFWTHVPTGQDDSAPARPHSGKERWETQGDAQNAGRRALVDHKEKETHS